MKVYYSDHLQIDLPPGHRFPIGKYALLHHTLLEKGILSAEELCTAEPATREEITLAHTPGYYDAVMNGSLSWQIIRQIGLPWSPVLAERAVGGVGGSLAAARQALKDGISGNLAGGTHHAFPEEGRGYCVFNDLAVVSLVLLKEKQVQRIAVVDLDVHQGNGTSAMLGKMPQVFILDIYNEKNYPYRKIPSTLDIGLPDGTEDEAYLQALEKGLEAVFAFRPDIVLFQAGVDVLADDSLGKLSLSLAGVERRDRRVIEECLNRRIPLTIVMGGGYAIPIERTVEAHAQTYRIAKEKDRRKKHGDSSYPFAHE